MKHVRLLNLTVMAVFMLGAVATATASAAETEAGLLYLPGETGQVTFEGTNTKAGGTLTSKAGKITCVTVGTTAHSSQTEKHVTTGLATITFTGCKLTKGTTKIACNTEGDAKEVLLLESIYTLFNALDRATKKVLEPGIGVTIAQLEAKKEKDEPTTLTIKCGAVANVLVKGTVLGLIQEVSLTADITSALLHFVNEGELCDSENAFCKKSQEKANELLANFIGEFEKAEEEAEISVTTNKMMLIDD